MYVISWKGRIGIVENYKRKNNNPISLKYWNILPNEVSTFKMDCDKLMSVIGW